jgi:asparagine synthase (glutamine-hydrolysing)
MCGIVAILSSEPAFAREELACRATGMADAIRHRGPDAGAVWTDTTGCVALAHRRLSIVDLSPAGAQPMVGAGGRYAIAFNGEIYNFRDVRAEVPARDWRGHSDTEVLLAAIETWGVQRALERCVGMFAFALWDAERRELVLARDRMGEKPLYYGLAHGALLVASELKAFEAWPGWTGDIDRQALEDFLRHSCVHAPQSIYRQVRKLPAGCLLRIPATLASRSLELEVERYWSLEAHALAGSVSPVGESPVDTLERILSRAIGEQMVADVPVGAFLSGGIDSSVIVALMQSQAARPVRTFSIGFHQDAYNEAHHAKAVARHLGTNHTELYVTAEEARQVIPRLPSMYDEPFGDSSQIPTFLVAQMARRDVTVSLSGDGGDELFGGYNRHVWARRVWGRMSRVPAPLRRAAGAAVRTVSPAAWDRIWRVMPTRLQFAQPGDKLHKLAGLSAARDGRAAYAWLVALHRGKEFLVEGVQKHSGLCLPEIWGTPGRELADDMMLADALAYLPDDVLTKVDRATMAVSLESRAPMLDHRVVEFAFSLPLDMKIRGRDSKWLLRQLLHRHVPKALIDRPKMGFGVPIDTWLRGELKPWAEALLEPDRLRRDGYIRPQPVTKAWTEHQSGQFNHQHFLWNVLMFQAWLERRATR